MSLFDTGDSNSDVESDVSSNQSGSSSCLLAPPPPPTTGQKVVPNGSTSGPGRNTLTEEDVRSAAAQRRQQLAQRLHYRGQAPRGGGSSFTLAAAPATGPGAGVMNTAHPQCADPEKDSSVFGNSIAAALQLRKTEQEKLLLKRIQRERKKEANDASLVEKDMEVGVFVTPAYKQMLRRHRRGDAPDGELQSHVEDVKDAEKRSEGDEEDDPLEAYLRSMEKKVGDHSTENRDGDSSAAATAAPSTGDYYDKMMRADLQAEQTRQRTEQRELETAGITKDVGDAPETLTTTTVTESPNAAPSPEELRALLLAEPAPSSPSTAPPVPVTPPKGNAATAVASAEQVRQEHQRFLYAARESRKRRRADAEFIRNCAARAEERMAIRLGIAV